MIFLAMSINGKYTRFVFRLGDSKLENAKSVYVKVAVMIMLVCRPLNSVWFCIPWFN